MRAAAATAASAAENVMWMCFLFNAVPVHVY